MIPSAAPSRPLVPLSAWARPWGPLALALLAAFAAVSLAWRRPTAITDDWQGWRQADTQAMARSQAFEAFDPLRPRIDWRGDGPGYVEAEMPIYPVLVSLGLRFFGDGPWPGQLLSLACVLFAGALLYRALARRFGGLAGWLALLTVLTGQGALVIATSIQPDTLSFLAFTVGWLAFLEYLDTHRARHLFTWILATAIAGLVKPTTLELGLAQGLVVLFAHRRALRDPQLWLGWILVLAVVALYLLHARDLYLTYGNTFGVLSGGDSKLPDLYRLSKLATWKDLARYALVWGPGWPSLLAIVILLLTGVSRLFRRAAGSTSAGSAFGAEVFALAFAALALDLLAFRYTSGPFGTHYHLPHAVLGATLVARAVAAIRPLVHAASSIVAAPAAPASADSFTSFTSVTSVPAAHLPRVLVRLLLVAFVGLSAFSAYRSVRFLKRLTPQPETALGIALSHLAPPLTLVAVRARAEGYNLEWHTTNNFEDPRVFYLSRTRGWALPNDLLGPAAVQRLEDITRRGARFYVHVNQITPDAALAAFLASRAQRVFSSPAGDIYALKPAP